MPNLTANNSWKRLSSFSVILIMIVLMIVGAAMLSLLKIQYTPTHERSAFTVSFSWDGASARVLEQEVTSKIEGALSTIDDISKITAISSKERGNITLWFKKGMKIDAARFEVATQIRQIYNKLPDGVSYPVFNMAVSGNDLKTILVYTINSDIPPDRIIKYAKEHITNKLSKIDGIESINFSGATPFEWVITFKPNIIKTLRINTSDISSAFNKHFNENIVGNISDGTEIITIRLKNIQDAKIENIPVRNINNRIYYLRDFATVEYKESLPNSYYRINGLNTINMQIMANPNINTIEISNKVKKVVDDIKDRFPQNYTLYNIYDESEYISKDLSIIFLRSILSLLILLVFVYAVSRSLKYLFVIFISILANLLIAVVFYYLFGLEIHIYSLAGVTISLSIIIDSIIVMVDHFSYYKNKTVFLSILGALLTTIVALLIVFLLPDDQKRNMTHFVWIIIINLSISATIAFVFIPSLLEKITLKRKGIIRLGVRNKRKVVHLSLFYERFINWGRKHRWIYIVVLVLAFGIPVHLLPTEIKTEENKNNILSAIYNKTIGSQWYQNNKDIFEKILGGSFRVFSKSLNSVSFYRQAQPQKALTISASMPEGCNVHQLNDIMRNMENFLSQYEEIDMCRTSISSYDNGKITVTFKKEYENTAFPFMLKKQVISKAIGFGGATWVVYGVDENGFSNNIVGYGYKSHSIKIKGYNYDALYDYANRMLDSLKTNRRVSELEIYSESALSKNEFFIEYDKEKIIETGLNTKDCFNYLIQQLYDYRIGYVFDGNDISQVRLVSSEKDMFDLWHIQNDLISIDSTKGRLTGIGTVNKRRSGNDIYRENHEYVLYIGFNFIGTYELADKIIKKYVDIFNTSVLPMGYKVESIRRYWTLDEQKQQTKLLLFVVLIIFGVCAILFESLRKPLAIIFMIPLGFIGLFLTFAWFNVIFDQGGFAAMIMLCGIVVNAGIYIINEYNTIRRQSNVSNIKVFTKAFNRKFIPAMLTIISTVLGLIPFLFDGNNTVFWFAFAAGVIGGMIFSIIALIIFLPIFLPLNQPPESAH
ncbi:MAG: efflux RND transporter permease subunit [Prevotellaceae bacterium]|jgi:multidrug efflux pump subunit AcrB|nr:efflux RND transporter permease subunit [Prevotellaceae bacterium]